MAKNNINPNLNSTNSLNKELSHQSTPQINLENQEFEIENEKSNQRIHDLSELNESQQNRISEINIELSQLQAKYTEQSRLSKKYQLTTNSLKATLLSNQSTITELQNQISIGFNERTGSDVITTPQLIQKTESLIPALSAVRTLPIEKHLLDLSLESKPSLLGLTKSIPTQVNPRLWYFAVGSTYENLVGDRQNNINFGVSRVINKRFDAGLLFDFTRIVEPNDYLINNDVKDHTLETVGLVLLRYKAIQIRKLSLYADAGLGYRFGTISRRDGRVIDNQIEYFNNSIPFQGVAYQIAIGGLYDVTNNLSIGGRAFLDTNLHVGANLQYKF